MDVVQEPSAKMLSIMRGAPMPYKLVTIFLKKYSPREGRLEVPPPPPSTLGNEPLHALKCALNAESGLKRLL